MFRLFIFRMKQEVMKTKWSLNMQHKMVVTFLCHMYMVTPTRPLKVAAMLCFFDAHTYFDGHIHKHSWMLSVSLLTLSRP